MTTRSTCLMSRRLFKHADANVAQGGGSSLQGHLREDARPVRLHGSEAQTTSKQQIAAYPFHPELIDVLYKKWSTSSDFPRTRAVLQLLANIVADQWVNMLVRPTLSSPVM